MAGKTKAGKENKVTKVTEEMKDVRRVIDQEVRSILMDKAMETKETFETEKEVKEKVEKEMEGLSLSDKLSIYLGEVDNARQHDQEEIRKIKRDIVRLVGKAKDEKTVLDSLVAEQTAIAEKRSDTLMKIADLDDQIAAEQSKVELWKAKEKKAKEAGERAPIPTDADKQSLTKIDKLQDEKELLEGELKRLDEVNDKILETATRIWGSHDGYRSFEEVPARYKGIAGDLMVRAGESEVYFKVPEDQDEGYYTQALRKYSELMNYMGQTNATKDKVFGNDFSEEALGSRKWDKLTDQVVRQRVINYVGGADSNYYFYRRAFAKRIGEHPSTWYHVQKAAIERIGYAQWASANDKEKIEYLVANDAGKKADWEIISSQKKEAQELVDKLSEDLSNAKTDDEKAKAQERLDAAIPVLGDTEAAEEEFLDTPPRKLVTDLGLAKWKEMSDEKRKSYCERTFRDIIDYRMQETFAAEYLDMVKEGGDKRKEAEAIRDKYFQENIEGNENEVKRWDSMNNNKQFEEVSEDYAYSKVRELKPYDPAQKVSYDYLVAAAASDFTKLNEVLVGEFKEMYNNNEQEAVEVLELYERTNVGTDEEKDLGKKVYGASEWKKMSTEEKLSKAASYYASDHLNRNKKFIEMFAYQAGKFLVEEQPGWDQVDYQIGLTNKEIASLRADIFMNVPMGPENEKAFIEGILKMPVTQDSKVDYARDTWDAMAEDDRKTMLDALGVENSKSIASLVFDDASAVLTKDKNLEPVIEMIWGGLSTAEQAHTSVMYTGRRNRMISEKSDVFTEYFKYLDNTGVFLNARIKYREDMIGEAAEEVWEKRPEDVFGFAAYITPIESEDERKPNALEVQAKVLEVLSHAAEAALVDPEKIDVALKAGEGYQNILPDVKDVSEFVTSARGLRGELDMLSGLIRDHVEALEDIDEAMNGTPKPISTVEEAEEAAKEPKYKRGRREVKVGGYYKDEIAEYDRVFKGEVKPALDLMEQKAVPRKLIAQERERMKECLEAIDAVVASLKSEGYVDSAKRIEDTVDTLFSQELGVQFATREGAEKILADTSSSEVEEELAGLVQEKGKEFNYRPNETRHKALTEDTFERIKAINDYLEYTVLRTGDDPERISVKGEDYDKVPVGSVFMVDENKHEVRKGYLEKLYNYSRVRAAEFEYSAKRMEALLEDEPAFSTVYDVEKLDENGQPVLDDEGNPVVEQFELGYYIVSPEDASMLDSSQSQQVSEEELLRIVARYREAADMYDARADAVERDIRASIANIAHEKGAGKVTKPGKPSKETQVRVTMEDYRQAYKSAMDAYAELAADMGVYQANAAIVSHKVTERPAAVAARIAGVTEQEIIDALAKGSDEMKKELQLAEGRAQVALGKTVAELEEDLANAAEDEAREDIQSQIDLVKERDRLKSIILAVDAARKYAAENYDTMADHFTAEEPSKVRLLARHESEDGKVSVKPISSKDLEWFAGNLAAIGADYTAETEEEAEAEAEAEAEPEEAEAEVEQAKTKADVRADVRDATKAYYRELVAKYPNLPTYYNETERKQMAGDAIATATQAVVDAAFDGEELRDGVDYEQVVKSESESAVNAVMFNHVLVASIAQKLAAKDGVDVGDVNKATVQRLFDEFMAKIAVENADGEWEFKDLDENGVPIKYFDDAKNALTQDAWDVLDSMVSAEGRMTMADIEAMLESYKTTTEEAEDSYENKKQQIVDEWSGKDKKGLKKVGAFIASRFKDMFNTESSREKKRRLDEASKEFETTVKEAAEAVLSEVDSEALKNAVLAEYGSVSNPDLTLNKILDLEAEVKAKLLPEEVDLFEALMQNAIPENLNSTITEAFDDLYDARYEFKDAEMKEELTRRQSIVIDSKLEEVYEAILKDEEPSQDALDHLASFDSEGLAQKMNAEINAVASILEEDEELQTTTPSTETAEKIEFFNSMVRVLEEKATILEQKRAELAGEVEPEAEAEVEAEVEPDETEAEPEEAEPEAEAEAEEEEAEAEPEEAEAEEEEAEAEVGEEEADSPVIIDYGRGGKLKSLEAGPYLAEIGVFNRVKMWNIGEDGAKIGKKINPANDLDASEALANMLAEAKDALSDNDKALAQIEKIEKKYALTEEASLEEEEEVEAEVEPEAEAEPEETEAEEEETEAEEEETEAEAEPEEAEAEEEETEAEAEPEETEAETEEEENEEEPEISWESDEEAEAEAEPEEAETEAEAEPEEAEAEPAVASGEEVSSQLEAASSMEQFLGVLDANEKFEVDGKTYSGAELKGDVEIVSQMANGANAADIETYTMVLPEFISDKVKDLLIKESEENE